MEDKSCRDWNSHSFDQNHSKRLQIRLKSLIQRRGTGKEITAFVSLRTVDENLSKYNRIRIYFLAERIEERNIEVLNRICVFGGMICGNLEPRMVQCMQMVNTCTCMLTFAQNDVTHERLLMRRIVNLP